MMMYFLPKRHLRSDLARGLIVECVGTFYLVLTIALATIFSPNAPLAIGMQLLAQVFAYGYVSGGMYNPAVTMAVCLVKYKRRVVEYGEYQGLMRVRQWLGFTLVQVFGGLLASLSAAALIGPDNCKTLYPAPQPNSVLHMDVGRAFFAEILYVITLVSVVLSTSVAKKWENNDNSFYGMGIGMTVFAGLSSVAKVSGAAFNPAVSTSLQLVRCMVASDLPNGEASCQALSFFWLYWVSSLIGSFIATVLFCVVSNEGDEPAQKPIPQDPKGVDESQSMLRYGAVRNESAWFSNTAQEDNK